MEARFRIRTREGEELRPRTTEIFAEFIRSGVVRPEDLVYDALTGEWVPAAMNPMVRLMKDPLANGWDPLEASPPPSSPAEGADAHVELDGSLDLVALPSVSPEEEARAFIERMEDERREDPEVPELSHEMPMTPVVVTLPDAPAAETATRTPATPRVVTRQLPRSTPVQMALPEPSRMRRSWARVGLVGLAGAASLTLLAVFTSVAKPLYRVGDHMPALGTGAAASERPPHRIANTEGVVRATAYQAFVASVGRMRGRLDVGPVPSPWLSGQYLSNPSAYPAVRVYWQRYLGYVEQARADEARLYREAYLQALDEAGVTGPVRSLRLATALADFDAGRVARTESYDRAWELAAASLALHDSLIALQGRISYEPAVGPRVSADPVIEAVGTDREAQVRLDGALDRVLRALRANGHTMDMGDLPGWLASSLGRVDGSGTTLQ